MSHLAIPLLKWAGGKGQLLKQFAPHLPCPEDIHCYYEPFVGSAALYFHLRPARAQLSDRNEKLIEVYQVVRDDLDSLIPVLQQHKNERDYYYEVRRQEPAQLTPAERAARLLFLNRTCYNGLYRENSSGAFNVPFGRYKNPKICDEPRLRAASQALQEVELRGGDFTEAVRDAQKGDFVYFDPPYVPLSATSNFTGYNRYGFSAADHQRLAATFQELSDRGCRAMLSNSSAPFVRELYDGRGFRILEVQARRNINSNGKRRGPITELLILNY